MRPLRFALLPLLCAVGAASAPVPALAGPYGSAWFLGDSLTDSGNAFYLTGGAVATPPYDVVPSSAYASGRITNGPVWAEYLADRLGVAAVASVPPPGTGTNYAIGAARIDDNNGIPGDGPSVADQLVRLGAGLGGVPLPADALVAVWAGGNDVRDALFSATPFADIDTAVGVLENILRGLVGLGARNLLVMTVPDLGLVPALNAPLNPDPSAAAAGTALSNYFNSLLTLALDQILTELPNLNLLAYDAAGFTRQVQANPAAYGLTDATSACLVFGTVTPPTQCADPDGFFFWDGIHPTTAGHALFADALYRVVPAPPAWWLLGAGLAVLVLRRQRRGAVPAGGRA